MRKGSIKNLRINGEVMRVIAEAVRTSKDPRISPMTSVTDVFVAPDLKTCKVYFSVLGDDAARASTLEGLKSAAGYLRSQVASKLNMRRTPELIFIEDDSTAYAIHMMGKIDEVISADQAAQEKREADGSMD